jgi:hypothetical protein
MAAIVVQELTVSFSSEAAPAPDNAAATVLTATSACANLQHLTIASQQDNCCLNLRSIPDGLAALRFFTSLELGNCRLQGLPKFPPNLRNLRVDDNTSLGVPASSSSALTALTRLKSNHTAAPPLVWLPHLQFLRVRLVSIRRTCFGDAP